MDKRGEEEQDGKERVTACECEMGTEPESLGVYKGNE